MGLIKHHYCISKKVGIDGKWFSKSFSREILDLQSFLFKLTMKNLTSKVMVEFKDENPIIKLWHQLATISLLVVLLFKFVKLAKLAIV
jgi:hypothetical protein